MKTLIFLLATVFLSTHVWSSNTGYYNCENKAFYRESVDSAEMNDIVRRNPIKKTRFSSNPSAAIEEDDSVATEFDDIIEREHLFLKTTQITGEKKNDKGNDEMQKTKKREKKT